MSRDLLHLPALRQSTEPDHNTTLDRLLRWTTFHRQSSSQSESAAKMAMSSEYAQILNDLNREVLRTRPTDPLQFCANWFNKRLEEQRNALQLRSSAAPSQVANASGQGLFASGNPFGAAVGSATNGSTGAGRQPSPFGSLGAAGVAVSASSTVAGDEEDMTDGTGPPGSANSNESFLPPPAFNFARRTSVSAESLAPRGMASGSASGDAGDGSGVGSSAASAHSKTVIPKTDSQMERIRAAIGNNLLFRNLEEDQYNDVLLAMKEVKVEPDEPVIEQGAQGDYFYVVESGTLDVYIKSNVGGGGLLGGSSASGSVTSDSEDGLTNRTATSVGGLSKANLGDKKISYGPGSSFGELALLYLQPRAATVLSTAPCTLWALDRVTFRSILMETNSRKRAMYDNFLKDVSLFEHLSDSERAKIGDALEIRTFGIGERPVKQGERGTEFFIIIEGVAEVKKRKSAAPGTTTDEEVAIGRLGRGDYFGELALLNNAPRAASIVAAAPINGEEGSATGATGKKLKVATLSEKAFTRLLGPLAGIMGRYAEERYGPTSGPSLGAAPSQDGSHLPGSIAPHQTVTTGGTWIGGSPFGSAAGPRA